MYISVPKNYGGSAFPRPDDAPAAHETPPHGFSHRSAPLPDFAAQPQTARLAPAPRPEPQCDCPREGRDPCDGREPHEPHECDRHEHEHEHEHEHDHGRDCDCGGDRCPKENKNPLTCLFEALRGRKKAGFDADDFLLIGLIALLMGKEGNEDIVLILALLLLV